MRRISTAFVVMVLLTGGCGPAPGAVIAEPPRPATQGLIDGTPSDATFVVNLLVTFGEARSTCTGAVIAPRVVLTARHCVDRGIVDPAQLGVLPDAVQVRLGPDSSAPVETRLAAEVRVPRDPVHVFPYDTIPWANGQDLAVIIVADDLGVAPVPFSRRSARELVGEPVTLYGYGGEPGQSERVREETTATVADTLAGMLVLDGPHVCEGDSGGPTVDSRGEVVAVTSAGVGLVCSTAGDVQASIASARGLLQEALRDTGACTPEEETCDGYDNSCDGVVDEGCPTLGAACTDGCAAPATCERGVCTLTCSPQGVVDDGLTAFVDVAICPSGFICARGAEDGCFVGACVVAGVSADGDECAIDGDCSTGLCAVDRDGVSRCRAPCSGGDAACADGLVCADVDGCGVCLSDAVPATTTGCAHAGIASWLALAGVVFGLRRRRGQRAGLLAGVVGATIVGACTAPSLDEPAALTPYARPTIGQVSVNDACDGARVSLPFVDEVGDLALQPIATTSPSAVLAASVAPFINLPGDSRAPQAAGVCSRRVPFEIVALTGEVDEDGHLTLVHDRRAVQIAAASTDADEAGLPVEVLFVPPLEVDGGAVFIGARYAAVDDDATCFVTCSNGGAASQNYREGEDGVLTFLYENDPLLATATVATK